MSDDERRRYFRIEESMGVAYRLVSNEEVESFTNQTASAGQGLNYRDNFDNRIQTLLNACRIQSPIAAELVDLVNKKLNSVISQLDLGAELAQQVAYTLRDVNVSACGMGFPCDDDLKAGQLLQLDILLMPDDLRITTLAEVVASQSQDDGDFDYYAKVNFIEISKNDEEFLIQHIVKSQSHQLKQQRINAETE